ncbi:hypothetical protein B0O80DRAFT_49185 [Mortierella sp. GBAus27b]|nr:hypothetical protein B0O80DRAFT_49185 [Mortierella sp. GBAus27b]
MFYCIRGALLFKHKDHLGYLRSSSTLYPRGGTNIGTNAMLVSRMVSSNHPFPQRVKIDGILSLTVKKPTDRISRRRIHFLLIRTQQGEKLDRVRNFHRGLDLPASVCNLLLGDADTIDLAQTLDMFGDMVQNEACLCKSLDFLLSLDGKRVGLP